MQHDTSPLSDHRASGKPASQSLPFTRYDFGWVLLCIGMAIGAGTVLMPVQIGLKGIWVFITASLIAYPATWIVQDIYLKTLSESETCNDYTDVISHYLGKNWGVFLGVIYFLMIIHGIFIYSLSVVFDSASYIRTFGLTDADLSQSLIYKVAIFAALVAIASGGEKLLFKISGPMVVVKVGIIVVFGLAMIPHWNLSNITAFPQASVFFRDVLLTIPFCFFSAVFIQVLNPMNIAYRKREADRVQATRMAIRTHRISYITLIAVILFFSFSFTFSITHEEAVSAFEQNISALALAAQVIPGPIIHITSTVLNIFAVLTAFFGIYLGFHEAMKGIILNVLGRIINVGNIPPRIITLGICAFIVTTLVIWVSFRVSVLVFFQLGSPLYGIVSCLIPFFLIYKVAPLEKLRGLKTWLILLYGMLLCLSPLLKLIE
ncbi:transporter [Citrobacter amalonaticus]|uniref:amino acid permease n=1 Tax=Citrobacter TaxID=544 RepID=UPI000C86D6D2|nr:MULTISPECIES: amino acid permease [Citrobacter]AUO66923.1 transporter [Citrobacter freundii complex sp. CFNIH2]MBJ9258388.1 transporter [Citrobacter amalonaticus]MCO4159784.1 amino acid permease [Citrobacter amalonaticus]